MVRAGLARFSQMARIPRRIISQSRLANDFGGGCAFIALIIPLVYYLKRNLPVPSIRYSSEEFFLSLVLSKEVIKGVYCFKWIDQAGVLSRGGSGDRTTTGQGCRANGIWLAALPWFGEPDRTTPSTFLSPCCRWSPDRAPAALALVLARRHHEATRVG